MKCIVVAVLVVLVQVAHAQMPRGFARPAGGAQQQQQQQPSENEMATNARLGLAGLHKLARDPQGGMADIMEVLQDPDALAEAKEMMQDPAFKREMEKISGPMKKAMDNLRMRQAVNDAERGQGEEKANLGMAALSRAMQDPSMLAESLRVMQDPKTMAEVRKMMSDPAFAQMVSQQMGSMKDLFEGLQAGGSEALGSRMRGLADWVQHQDEQQQLRDMLG